MRITGRILRPSTLAERRVLFSLCAPTIRVPRKLNPYLVARKLARLAHGESPDLLFIRDVVERSRKPKPQPPVPSPDMDMPAPVGKSPFEAADAAGT